MKVTNANCLVIFLPNILSLFKNNNLGLTTYQSYVYSQSKRKHKYAYKMLFL